jgi:bifunctional non-homologous end joining protein LigD
MTLREVKQPFTGPEWSWSIKYDGFRILAGVSDGLCRLKSRGGADATRWFPEVAGGLATVRGQHIFDGEVVVMELRPQ